jgi:hypothetical protein
MPVEFNDESQKATFLYAKIQASNQSPALVRWLVEYKIVGSTKQANNLLIGLIIVCVAAGVFVLYRSINHQNVIHLTPEEIQRINERNP